MTAAAAAVTGHPIVFVLELWAPSAAADRPAATGRRSVDDGAEVFSQLFGDFDAADPSLMHGVVAVALTNELGRELQEAEMEAEAERSGMGGGRRDEGGGRERGRGHGGGCGRGVVLNKVFEVRNPILGSAGGYIGVEGRVVR